MGSSRLSCLPATHEGQLHQVRRRNRRGAIYDGAEAGHQHAGKWLLQKLFQVKTILRGKLDQHVPSPTLANVYFPTRTTKTLIHTQHAHLHLRTTRSSNKQQVVAEIE
jgi:hypothetical protein